MAKLRKEKLKVDGMDCAPCTMLIDGDLENLEGVRFAKTHYAKAECEVEYDEELVTLNKIRKVIENRGYKVQIQK